jgi:DnaK suppressor protein
MYSENQRYRDRLLSLRHQAMGTVGHVADAIREDVNPSGARSNAPVHLADVAEVTVDSDAEILQIQGGLLENIESALSRINDGTYGCCVDCGAKISKARLDAIPYTPCCVDCANRRDEAEDKAAFSKLSINSRQTRKLVNKVSRRSSKGR